jgi:hypothetical protein
MKLYFLLSLLTATALAIPPVSPHRKKPKPQEKPVAVQEQADDEDEDYNDDEDEKVILANFGGMLTALGTFTTAPHDPAVAGPALFQAAANVVNIIVQAFKGIEIRGPVTHKQIEEWFNNLPDSTKIEMIRLLTAYAQALKTH